MVVGSAARSAAVADELLEVVKDVRQAIIGVPGFGFFRRRGEDKLGEGE
ncbi:hypothetical protein [Prescottella agglutinans]